MDNISALKAIQSNINSLLKTMNNDYAAQLNEFEVVLLTTENELRTLQHSRSMYQIVLNKTTNPSLITIVSTLLEILDQKIDQQKAWSSKIMYEYKDLQDKLEASQLEDDPGF